MNAVWVGLRADARIGESVRVPLVASVGGDTHVPDLSGAPGRTSVPVRTTVGGAIVGLGAMVASLVFGASLGHLLGSPPLYGVTWDTEIWNNNGPAAMPSARPVVRADPDVATAAFIQTGIDFRLGGRVISGFAYDPVVGTFAASMLTGRVPARADEVARGASTAAQLGARTGDTLLGNAENAGAPRVRVRMAGTVVLPPGDVSAHLGDGVIATRVALLRMAGGQARRRQELLHPVADETHRPAELRADPGPSAHPRLGAGRPGPRHAGAPARHLDLAAATRPGHPQDARIHSGRGGPDRRLAGDHPGGDHARRRPSSRGGRRPDGLGSLRRAAGGDPRRLDPRRTAGPGRAGHHRPGQPRLDRAGPDGHADPPSVGAARGVPPDTE